MEAKAEELPWTEIKPTNMIAIEENSRRGASLTYVVPRATDSHKKGLEVFWRANGNDRAEFRLGFIPQTGKTTYTTVESALAPSDVEILLAKGSWVFTNDEVKRQRSRTTPGPELVAARIA